jgi:hypothetical protein
MLKFCHVKKVGSLPVQKAFEAGTAHRPDIDFLTAPR